MSKRILVIVAVVAVVILGFILIYGKTIAPTSEKQVDVQSEVDKLKEAQGVSSEKSSSTQPAQNNISANNNVNNNNNNPMQLEIKTTQAGSGEKTVKSGDTIDVYYTGKLTDGKIFDSNAGSGKPFEFTVGAGMVIQGWEQGFIGAKVGEKRTLTIPANLGYGPAGSGPIPPNATLIFDVELVSIK